jgi:hypothetical protein
MGRAVLIACVCLAACSNERLAREGVLPGGETFREYSRIPYGYERIIYAPDGREMGRQQLHTEENFRRIQPGMTKAELADVIGAGFATLENYADGSSSLTWRYYDGVYKLLHVIFSPDARVVRYETQWDPNVYSKKK